MGEARRRVSWWFWPLLLIVETLAMVIGASLAIPLGVNPYLGALLGGGAYALLVTFLVGLGSRRRRSSEESTEP